MRGGTDATQTMRCPSRRKIFAKSTLAVSWYISATRTASYPCLISFAHELQWHEEDIRIEQPKGVPTVYLLFDLPASILLSELNAWQALLEDAKALLKKHAEFYYNESMVVHRQKVAVYHGSCSGWPGRCRVVLISRSSVLPGLLRVRRRCAEIFLPHCQRLWTTSRCVFRRISERRARNHPERLLISSA